MTDAAEEIRRAMKTEKYLLLSTGHKAEGEKRFKLKEYVVDFESFCNAFKPLIGDDVVIAAEFLNKTVGETVLNAEIADYAALIRRLFSIAIDKTITSATVRSKVKKTIESFNNEHAEKENETAMLIGTVDK